MRNHLLTALTVSAVLFVLQGCRKDDEAPAPTEPWPAPAATPAESEPEEAPRAKLEYEIQPGSVVQLSLPAKEAKPTGAFRIVQGRIALDLLDLTESRGTVEIDLGSVLMDGPSERLERQYTAQARQWLNLGASRPDAEIERIRFARFVVDSVQSASHAAPHLGRRLRVEAEAKDGSAAHAFAERRRVSLTLAGDLEMNGLRVRRTADLQLDFDYAAPATEGLPPSRIRLVSTRPVAVALGEHEVQPRDPHGRLAAAELDLLGRVVGRKAHVTFRLHAMRASGEPQQESPSHEQ